jgi:Asp-tRNA(Asn)/Glu-tRNA(Gln) amidotransferase C subunit
MIEIDKEKMESLKALADINLKVSEARNLLTQLEEEETEYLVKRETKVMDRIKKTVADSQAMVKEADDNYSQIGELLQEITSFCSNIVKIQEQFNEILEVFNERNELWEKNIGEQQDNISEVRKQIKMHTVIIENDKKSLSSTKKLLESQRIHIESQQAALLKSYQEEKTLWDKIQKKS